MAEMLLKVLKYMNIEDALAAIKQGDTRKERRSVWEDQKGKKRERGDHSSNRDGVKRRDDKPLRMVKFTPLVILVDKIFMQTEDDHMLNWPKPLHSLPSIRDNKKYCLFL